MSIINQISSFFSLVRRGQCGTALGEIGRRFYSNHVAFGLSHDLSQHAAMPEARISISVRPLQPDDIPQLFDESEADNGESLRHQIRRLRHIQANIPTCYVAVDVDRVPCYTQWLMGSADNERIQQFFGGEYPHLKKDEMLLENAYTPEAYRGLRIMPCAMWQITAKAADHDARRVITFVGEENIASLKGCARAGFSPYLVRHDKWRFFRRTITFESYSIDRPYPLDFQPTLKPV